MSQFFYIHPDNPQQRLINQAVDIVRKGGVIVYPTDSGYALGCKIEDKGAMERICRIRHLPDGHNFTLMCRDLSELSTYSYVDNSDKPRVWVIDFKGSMDAHEVNALREEVTAVLAVAKPGDRAVVRLESPGGVVHGYGLAASQLQRLRDKNIPLTVTVDKVAASGGYMMACVAEKIIAAPFAIVGSIGVVAQIPNFNRFLKSKDIDIELHTAGQYKRTLTLLGENTEEGRQKFREDLNETHHLFKEFVQRMRPALDIEQVATGEHWYGQQALEKGLVDEINTSDEVILGLMEGREVLNVRYMQRKKLIDRVTGSAAESADRLLLRWWQRGQKPLM